MRKKIGGNSLVFLLIFSFLLGFIIQNIFSDNSCPKPACVDNARVIPITDRGYFDAAHEILSNAEKSIHIASFELKYYEKYPDSQMNVLISDLIKAKERGVDVKIVVDQFSRENNAYHKLDEAGISWKFDSNKTTTHSKLIIVDGKIVLIGSTNLSYYGLEKNNEANVLIIDENTGRYFENYFNNLWNA